MTLEATFSTGCPCDSDEILVLENADLLNNTVGNFNVVSKISFYPLGTTDYMDNIAHVVNMAVDKNIYITSKHYITILEGNINDIFEYIQDVINSVGYRVKSHRGTAFRIWSTSVLHEYIKKGFVLDDERIMGANNYFDELLSRIPETPHS